MRSLTIAACAASLLAAPALAQETPTEREAARDVLKKMGELETSLDVPGLVAKLTGPNPARDAVTGRAKELMEKELLALGDDITRNPEIGFVEKRSVAKLTDYLNAHGFEVTIGTPGLETAFVAKYKGNNGPPNLGVIVEYDALRGTERAFHGDQHSTQGPIGIAAAVAMAEYLAKSKAPGSVVVFGTPGEEMMPPNAKTEMHKAGVFNGMDILVRSHASSATTRPAPGFGTCCLNIDGVKYTFSGAPAHQMTSWNGRNALTAVIHLFNNIDAVRSNIRPEARIQGVITEGGAAPNVVPDRTVADFYIRYPDEVYLKQIREFTDNAARAAALATGTKVKIDHYGTARDGISVATLAEVGFAYMKKFGAIKVTPEPGKPQGYEETGSVSRHIPGLGFSAASSNFPNHTYEMEADALTEVGHSGFVIDALGMTALLFDFATRPDYRALVKREFEGIQALQNEYIAALEKPYQVPKVPEPR
ncbi:MAG: peptidase dimerization domain-containing protein [Vicinamibacteria bacterium]|nr:peptidase dimerization domain-containing protein [Vicinamibacteria bacterium]